MKILFWILLSTSGFGYSSTVSEELKWRKNEISVCWTDKKFPTSDFYISQIADLKESGALNNLVELDEKLKKGIHNLISREFKSARTGIHFTGWKTCAQMSNWDVALVVSEPGENTIPFAGMAILGNKDSRKSFVYINLNQKNNMSLEQNVLTTALHEFGHVAGLKHEHQREEAQADPLCHKHRVVPDPQEHSSSQYYSEYDPSSIMNYCFRFMAKISGLNFTSTREFYNLSDSTVVKKNGSKIAIKIGLSQGDVHALKCLYKISDDSAEFYRMCNSTYPIQ